MANYLLTYLGGTMPESEEEGAAIMAAWTAWMGSVGEAFVDPGAPVGATRTLGSDGSITDGGGPNGVTGYSVLSADSLDAAIAVAKGCPHLDPTAAGGSVVVQELVAM